MTPPTAEIELANNYVRFACIAAFLYDWVLTIGNEVDFGWSMNWRGSKTLFLLLRYVTLVQMALTAMYFMDLPHSTILIQSYVSTLLEVVIICLVQVLLQLRIYIVYGRSKKLLWSNAVFFVVELVLVFLLFVKTASKIKSMHLPPPPWPFRIAPTHQKPFRCACDADAALPYLQHLPQRDGPLFRRTCAQASPPPDNPLLVRSHSQRCSSRRIS